MSDGRVFDAREAFADDERGGDLLWSATPAAPIPLRRRDQSRTDEPPVATTPHGDLPSGGAARRARVQAARAAGVAPAPPFRPPGPSAAASPAPDQTPHGHRAPAIAPPPRPGGPRRLGEPRSARVRADERGRPLAVDGRAVEGVRESWLVEDRWWTDRPLRRRYWEVVTDDGRNLVVFRELGRGGWYRQRS